MLILNRKKSERIQIGDDIVITVTQISEFGTDVSIGIDAPKTLPVHREEIYKLIQKEKIAALEEELKAKQQENGSDDE